MIFYFHTPNVGSVMVGADHIPRKGEIFRLTQHPDWPKNHMTGLFEIENVLYEAPNNPGRQRVDVYGRQVAELPSDLSYSAVHEALGGSA